MVTIVFPPLIYQKVYLSSDYLWFLTGLLVRTKTAVQLIIESTMPARAIAIVMTMTQLSVTYADAIEVMKEIPTIPLAAQVNSLFILLSNVTLPIFAQIFCSFLIFLRFYHLSYSFSIKIAKKNASNFFEDFNDKRDKLDEVEEMRDKGIIETKLTN
jgi:hypothetical protein